MATIELEKSRRSHSTTGGKERTFIWKVDGTPPNAIKHPSVPQIGDELVGEPEFHCTDVVADHLTKDGDQGCCRVIATYSTQQTLLTNVGDMKFDYDFSGKTEQVSFAPRVLHEGHIRYPDGWETDSDGTRVFVKREIGQFGDTISAFRPQLAMRITKILDKDMLNAHYSHWYSATGKVNNGAWNNRSGFTMLFTGGDVPQTGINRWTGTFYFLYDAGEHDYAWFKMNMETQEVEGDAYWSELYGSYDFSLLGLDKPPE